MSQDRHSYVAFYPSDWLGGTARMTRTQRSVYFDVCCYNWDKASECPPSELALMLGDLDGWQGVVDLLVSAEKLYRTPDGSVGSTKAMSEAKKALELWTKKSQGGKDGAGKTNAKRGVGSHVGSGVESADKTGSGLPSQNQNQNQNQLEGAQCTPSKPKRERKIKIPLPSDSPTSADRDAAAKFWRERGRDDLCARLGDEAEAFRAHHAAHGKRMEDWGAAWRTWYGNAMRFQTKPKNPVASTVPRAAYDDTHDDRWRDRLRTFQARGSWAENWGPRPDEPGCKCPAKILHEQVAAE